MTSRSGVSTTFSDEPDRQSPTQEEESSTERRPSASEVSAGEQSSHPESTLHPEASSPCFETQSSNVSEITVPSRIGPAGDEPSVESDTRNSFDQAESSGSLTFHPHFRDRPSDDAGSSGIQSGSPSSPENIARRPTQTEITEYSSSQATGSNSGSELTFKTTASNTSTSSQRNTSRKRRHFWENLKRGGERLRKRICCCFSPKVSDQMSTGNEQGLRIGSDTLQWDENGILRTDVAMDSATTRDVEYVVSNHDDFIVFSGERLEAYCARMRRLFQTCFDNTSGEEVLRLWRLDLLRPNQPNVEILPSKVTGPRILSLNDVRLLNPMASYDRSDDSIFRYFLSREGLSQRMLLSGRA